MGGAMLNPRQSLRLRQIVIICVGLLALYLFLPKPEASLDSSRTLLGELPENWKSASSSSSKATTRLSEELLNNRFLTAQQCASAFPGLTREIDDAVAKGPFVLEKSGPLGPLIAQVKNGKLFILHAASTRDLSRDMILHRTATLHQIHRALLTAPSPLEIPDTIFAFNHHDNPTARTFSYSRPADPARNGPSAPYFPIPHFGFWSWPLPFIKSLPDAASAIAALESGLSWSGKDPRAVWRGTPHFNSPSTASAHTRQDLVLTAGHRPWSDVEALEWTGPNGRNASNALPIADFCGYRYIVHTEGVTYSGRMPFHQLCASVVLTPPLGWMQHTSRLIRPVFSYNLPGDGVQRTLRPGRDLGGGVVEKVSLAPYPSAWVAAAWGGGYTVDEANMVFVAPDWSDLEAVVGWLERHPDVAEGIARRQRETYHGAGFLSPAAETCYWRAAIRGWSSVVDYRDLEVENMEAVPYEEFVITQNTK
ncbi:hypothetical protein PFICI_07280 [Pestalotiopsis fici W106-1]|uniref:Glycosyl transferase CAP10 domain-containing protein n=1 Tax=Pestalotiopsis fici (strain W106-1 / CGMCC3.15140) TaxID=1229662 RepID=W3X843_PESFW|nr:uncharacterized protein PFICI_07280 [Pestalotiopsis fici W106-1]ETS82278.1 hypothetical protein PFICI_07280 [Pestalotiopsis fici W106-1]